MSDHAGDDPTPRAGEGGPYRKTPTQLATDPAFTGTYANRAAPSYAPASSVSRFDPRLAAYNVNTATVGRTRAALARASVGGRADIRIIGHSIVSGGAATSPRYQKSFPARLRDLLTRRFGNAGTGLVPLNANTDVDTDSRLTWSGTWTTDSARGFASKAAVATNGATLYWDGVLCDKFWLYSSQRSDSGAVNAYIDQTGTRGAGSGSSGLEVAASEAFLVLGKAASALGVHSLRLDAFGAANLLAVEGTISNAVGVRVSRLGYSGTKLAAHVDATNPTSALYCATMPNANAAGPDCIVFMCMINDAFNAGQSATAYAASLTSALTTWKAAGAEVILMVEPPPQTSGTGYSPTPLSPVWDLPTWQGYLSAIYGVADAVNVALLDVNLLFGQDWSVAKNTTQVMGDSLHPNDAGHWEIAQALFNIMAPSAAQTAQVGSASASPQSVNNYNNAGTAYTIPDPTVASMHYVTLTANSTFTFPTATVGASFDLAVVQDATGSRTVTWPGTVKWAGGSAPTLTTTAAKADLFRFRCLDGTNWLAEIIGQAY